MRCTDLALRKLFTVKQWREIEDEAIYRTVTVDRKTDKETWSNNTYSNKEKKTDEKIKEFYGQ